MLSPLSSNAPRLLYVSHVDTVVRMMLPHLDAARARGWQVEIACCLTRHAEDMYAHADVVHPMPFRRSPLDPANLLALQQLTALIKKGNYTIVHAHTPTGGVIGRLAATLAQRPETVDGKKVSLPLRVYTPHGFHFHTHGSKLSNTLFRTIETVAGQNWSDAVLTINNEDYEAAKGTVVPAEKIYLTGGVGVSEDEYSPEHVTPAEREATRKELLADAPPDTLLVTYTGEMIPRKRHVDALDAFAQFVADDRNALLILLGDGVLMPKVRAQAEALGITDRIRFLGFRRDVRNILAVTDIFLFPSLQEGLPCSVQEALCMEVPTIAAAVRGSRDLVDDSCGRIVPPRDPAALTQALRELADLPSETRHALGRNGREKMATRFGRAACVAEWMEIYDELLGAG